MKDEVAAVVEAALQAKAKAAELEMDLAMFVDRDAYAKSHQNGQRKQADLPTGIAGTTLCDKAKNRLGSK